MLKLRAQAEGPTENMEGGKPRMSLSGWRAVMYALLVASASAIGLEGPSVRGESKADAQKAAVNIMKSKANEELFVLLGNDVSATRFAAHAELLRRGNAYIEQNGKLPPWMGFVTSVEVDKGKRRVVRVGEKTMDVNAELCRRFHLLRRDMNVMLEKALFTGTQCDALSSDLPLAALFKHLGKQIDWRVELSNHPQDVGDPACAAGPGDFWSVVRAIRLPDGSRLSVNYSRSGTASLCATDRKFTAASNGAVYASIDSVGNLRFVLEPKADLRSSKVTDVRGISPDGKKARIDFSNSFVVDNSSNLVKLHLPRGDEGKKTMDIEVDCVVTAAHTRKYVIDDPTVTSTLVTDWYRLTVGAVHEQGQDNGRYFVTVHYPVEGLERHTRSRIMVHAFDAPGKELPLTLVGGSHEYEKFGFSGDRPSRLVVFLPERSPLDHIQGAMTLRFKDVPLLNNP